MVIDQNIVAFAEEIKKSCKENNLSIKNDWELYRLASVSEGNIKNVLTRVKNMRAFEEERKIDHVDDIEAFKSVHEVCPDYFFGFTGLDKIGRQVLHIKLGNFEPGKFMKEEQIFKYLMKTLSNHFNGYASSVEEYERGIVLAISAKGVGLKNFSLKFEKAIGWMRQHGYPAKIKQVVVFDSGTIFQKCFGLIKKCMSEKMKKRILVKNADKVMEIINPDCVPAVSHPEGTFSKSVDEMSSHFGSRMKAFREFETNFVMP